MDKPFSSVGATGFILQYAWRYLLVAIALNMPYRQVVKHFKYRTNVNEVMDRTRNSIDLKACICYKINVHSVPYKPVGNEAVKHHNVANVPASRYITLLVTN